MIDLRLTYEGNGVFRAIGKLDHELCANELEQGERVRAKVTRQRSVRQNDFFHALIEAAFENQRGGPSLPSWRHLKSWLLIQADHCTVKRFRADAMTPQVAAYLRTLFDTVDFTADDEWIYFKVAKTVAFQGPTAPDSEEMGRIVDKVVAIICTEIVPGLKPEEILELAKEKAA